MGINNHSDVEEVWQDIDGYEGLYQISNYGMVKSLPRNNTIKKPRILHNCYNNKGYCMVSLCKNNKAKNYRIHRLVAQAFIPNPNNLPEINHKDENKKNNRVDNLEWCNSKYNNTYGNRTKIASIKCSKPVSMFDVNGNYIRTYKSCTEASKETGISVCHISNCCLNRYGRKTAGGYIWRHEKEMYI